jgi:hypothetical protein
MKIIPQAAYYLDTTGMSQYQIIERVGRTCYKSEDKITDGSANKFVASLAKSGHHAMIEFGYIFLKITDIDFCEWFIYNKPDFIRLMSGYVVGNMRAFYDWYNAYLTGKIMFRGDDPIEEFTDLLHMLSLKYPEVYGNLYVEFHETFEKSFDDSDTPNPDDVTYPFILMDREEFYQDFNSGNGNINGNLKYITPHIVKFTTNRAISHEVVRHRVCSFAQESTRYCNYVKGKFGGELTVIEPMFKEGTGLYATWFTATCASEAAYFSLVENGATPQEARGVLTNDLKTDIWVGAFEDEWQHILNLRYHGTTGAPHPQIKELMGIAYPQLVKASEGRLK